MKKINRLKKYFLWVFPVLVFIGIGFWNFSPIVIAANFQEWGFVSKEDYVLKADIQKAEEEIKKNILKKEKDIQTKKFDRYFVTGYQAVGAQTDSTPGIAAWNDNIVGAINVAAVVQNSHLKRGTCLKIAGLKETYIVLDRLNKKYNGRKKIDILVRTKKEAHRITGTRKIQILPVGSCTLKRMVNGQIREEKFSRKKRFKL